MFFQKMFLRILENSQKIHRKNIFAGISFLTKLQAGNLLQTPIKNLANFAGKNLCWSLFLIKLEFGGPATLLKKIPIQVFSCEIYKRFKSNYFEEHL